MNVSAQARGLGMQADHNEWLERGVRVGLASYGVVHLIVAWLALNLAFGSDKGQASGSGALAQLAQSSLGRISLYVVGVGFVALAFWQLLEAAFGKRDSDGAERVMKRLASAGKTVIYGLLAYSSFGLASGSGSGGGGGGTDSMTAKVMSWPAGPFLVGLIGLGVLVVGGFLIYRGLSEGFAKHLDAQGKTGHSGKAYVTFGKVGYVAKGLVLFPVGGLFIWAAFSHDPKKSGGLDQALHTVLQQPFGAPLLVAIAVGLAAFGLYCFAWARHFAK